MSRIGNKIIQIPKNVYVTFDGKKLVIKGLHGTLERNIFNTVNLEINNETILIKRLDETKKTRSYHGLIRALIQNMITGVNEKFSKTLIAHGVGYRFQIEATTLIINIGYSHPVLISIPHDLQIKLDSTTKITISGIDRENVGLFTSRISKNRPPEPYKGKGLLFEGEQILRKAGKTGR
jgi:large subunit ribosomal protein L6